MHEPSWPTAYAAGVQAGYAARCAEEADHWKSESSRSVLVGGQFWERPTAAAVKEEREAIMREAHGAGLHDGRRRMCPLCQGDQ